MKTPTLAMVRHAQANGYAVPAFNVVDDLSLRAVIQAADAADSPVIIQISVKTARSLGIELITAMFDAAADRGGTPVALHLDHCPDRQVIERVVQAGWSSVLFDASDRDLARAQEETAEVVRLAHAHGVEVESEIENIVGIEDGVGSDVLSHAYTVRQLADVAEATGTDLIAPQLGTSHGEYRGRPTLLPDRVRELRAATDRPVVLHGGTGLNEAEFRAMIAAGVSKINVSTAIKRAYLTSAYDFLQGAHSRGEYDPPALFDAIAESIRSVAAEFFDIFGSAGRGTALRAAL